MLAIRDAGFREMLSLFHSVLRRIAEASSLAALAKKAFMTLAIQPPRSAALNRLACLTCRNGAAVVPEDCDNHGYFLATFKNSAMGLLA